MGYTPLHSAIIQNKTEITNYFIKHYHKTINQISFNLKTSVFQTSLSFAEEPNIRQILLAAGAKSSTEIQNSFSYKLKLFWQRLWSGIKNLDCWEPR